MDIPTEKQPHDFSPDRTLVDYFYLFLEKLWLILIFLIVGLVYAHRDVAKIPTLYESRATIEVLRETKAVGNLSTSTENRLRYSDLTGTVAQKLNLNGLFYEVASAPEFKSLLPEAKFNNAAEIESAKWRLAHEMNEWTTIRVRPMSPLIDIVGTHSNPQVARDVVAVMLREYRELGSTKRIGETTANLNLLNQQINEIRTRLSKSEQSLVIYKQALQIRDEIRRSENKIREMEKVYLPKWPALVQEKKHLDSLLASFSEELRRITDQSEGEYEFWKKEIEKTGELAPESKYKFQLQTAEARNNMLNRDYDSDSKLYESLLGKLKVANVEREYKPSEVSVLEPPLLPAGPRFVNKTTYYLKYGAIGLGLGMGLALFLGSMDTRIRRVEDLERLANTQVLTAVPKSSKLAKGLTDKTNSAEYEAFRTLHTNNILAVPDSKVILVTSSTPKEGKSTVSTNLAAISAAWGWGEKVLIIDLDLRKPIVHKYLDLPEDTKGVGDYLIAKANINECITRHAEIPELYVMPGGATRFQGKLPDVDDLVKMLTLLKSNFDRIIVDSAPLLAVSDTLVIGKHVDEICLVFRMWKTPRKALIRSLTQLSQNETYPFGVVANFMPNRSALGQYNYYYSYASSGYQSYATPEQAK